MRATLTFELPEEKCELDIAVHAMDWAVFAWDLDQKLRGIIKYGETYGGKTIDVEDAELIREILHDTLDEHNLNLDMIQ